jgi:hypothetical protein
MKKLRMFVAMLVGVMALVLGLVGAPAMADTVIYSHAGPTTVNAGSVAAVGAGNVNNAVLGTDRRLVISYDVSTDVTSTPTERWFAISLGDNDAIAPTGTWPAMFDDADALLLTRTEGATSVTPHSLVLDNRNQTLGFNPPSSGGSASVRLTVDLSPTGIQTNEPATVTAQIDNNGDGTYDALQVGSFTWDGPNNYMFFGSKSTGAHQYSNLEIKSTTRPPSFTFDFQNPDGTGSSFADAIPLDTLGAITDKNGAPIGFTQSNQSDGTEKGDVELTDAGLEFNTSHAVGGTVKTIMLGVPFATDGSGLVKVIARYSGEFGDWDKANEMTGVLMGDANSDAINNAHSLLGWQKSDGFVQCLTPDPWGTGRTDMPDYTIGEKDITQMILAGETTSGGTLWGTITAAQTHSITATDGHDGGPNHLGQSGAYAYFFVDSSGTNANGFTGTLTSITFEGPNLIAPSASMPIAEPAGLGLLGLALLGLRKRRS